jgi:hypothetical protein
MLPYSAKAVRKLWAWPVHIHQREGCRINIWTSNDDDVYVLKIYSQFTFHLSDLKIIFFSIYIYCLYLHLLVALSLLEAWPPKRRSWSVSVAVLSIITSATEKVFHSSDQVRRYGKGAIISVTEQVLTSFDRRRRCSKRLLKLV